MFAVVIELQLRNICLRTPELVAEAAQLEQEAEAARQAEAEAVRLLEEANAARQAEAEAVRCQQEARLKAEQEAARLELEARRKAEEEARQRRFIASTTLICCGLVVAALIYRRR